MPSAKQELLVWGIHGSIEVFHNKHTMSVIEKLNVLISDNSTTGGEVLTWKIKNSEVKVSFQCTINISPLVRKKLAEIIDELSEAAVDGASLLIILKSDTADAGYSALNMLFGKGKQIETARKRALKTDIVHRIDNLSMLNARKEIGEIIHHIDQIDTELSRKADNGK